jgi:hypothetical protein
MMAFQEVGAAGGTLARPPISSYMGELPNSHVRTLTDKSYVMHGIPSGTYLRHLF